MRGTRSQAGTGRGQGRGTGGGVRQNRQGRGNQNPPRPPARQQQIIPPAQANPQAPAFALTPALAKRGILDYETRAGERIYEAATKPLDTKEKYDGESSGLYQFLKLLKERARNYGWDDGIMSIPSILAGNRSLYSASLTSIIPFFLSIYFSCLTSFSSKNRFPP